jgi:UDPglucose 6-dehydrogenase
MAKTADFNFTVLEAAVNANEASMKNVVAKIKELFNNELRGVSIAVWGITFKAGTDDIRDSPAVDIVVRLVSEGASVTVFDPVNKATLPSTKVANTAYDACADAQALVVLTEWPEFAAADLTQVSTLMTGRVILDTRNIVSAEAAYLAGFRYLAIGRQTRDATPDMGNAWTT